MDPRPSAQSQRSSLWGAVQDALAEGSRHTLAAVEAVIEAHIVLVSQENERLRGQLKQSGVVYGDCSESVACGLPNPRIVNACSPPSVPEDLPPCVPLQRVNTSIYWNDESEGVNFLQQWLTKDKGVKMSQSRLFPDKNDMIIQVQEALCQPTYEVSNFYHTEGVCQRIARSNTFEVSTLAVIAFNAVWIAIDADLNDSKALFKAHPIFIVVDNFLCVYFFGEWFIRLCAFRRKVDGLKDAWFAFDSILMGLTVLETWVIGVILSVAMGGQEQEGIMGEASVLRIFRLLRLTRTARMAKLMRRMPELMIMVKGMLAAVRSVFFTLVLLLIIIYVFAIAFRLLTDGQSIGATYFPSIPLAMSSLLLHGALPDVALFVYELDNEHVVLAALGLFFILMTALVLLNMLIGVLVNVVLVEADMENEQITANFVKASFQDLLHLGDMDGDERISKEEFSALLMRPEAAKVLDTVRVDIVGLASLKDFIFEDGNDSLSFQDLFKLVLSLRGANTATVKDLVDLRKFFAEQLDGLRESIENGIASLLEQAQFQSHQANSQRTLPSRSRTLSGSC